MEQYYPNLLILLLGLLLCVAAVLVGFADLACGVVVSLAQRHTPKSRSKLCLPNILLFVGLVVFAYGGVSLVAQIFGIHVSFGEY